MEYPPLFAPGIHNITLSDMPEIFVTPFKDPSRRAHLLRRFESFLEKLKEIPVEMEIWIDGSFSTHKENPGDIDLVVVIDAGAVNQLTIEQQLLLKQIGEDHKTVRHQYECDAFIVLNQADDFIYWEDFFSRDRNNTLKGIPKIKIGEAV